MGNFCGIAGLTPHIRTVVFKKAAAAAAAQNAVENRRAVCYDEGKCENGTFAVLGPDGKQVQCDVLFTYDCEDNGRSYVVFTTGEGAQQQLFANRYAAREDGQPALFPLENEQEYQIIKHCFEELKAKLAEQAAAQEGEAKA